MLKAHASELLRAVEQGEVIIVTRHGHPIARLEAVGLHPQPQMGLRGLYAHLAPALEDLDLQAEIRQLRQASTAQLEK
jgi:antitoxin (DNA-binding transcriptional repressor) of toxin-antitoxin stability system